MEYSQFMIILLLSPLLQGVIKKTKALMQGRKGPGVLQPYFDLLRLFRKDMTVSSVTSWIFRASPYIQFTTAIAVAMIVPVITAHSPFWMMGDIIAVIYIFGLGRFFLALAGLDAGTAFGGEGSSREMTVAILVEPMIMLSIFTASISAGSTNLSIIAGSQNLLMSPSHILAFLAFLVAVIAETGRIPVDNPDTHLELTMIHEGMVLEYSGRRLALMEWSYCIRQMVLFTLAFDVFLPAGLSPGGSMQAAGLSVAAYFMKLAGMAVFVAFIESSRAKMRFFQLPSLLGGGFVLALLSLITYIMMGK